jgi:hypothetical protein
MAGLGIAAGIAAAAVTPACSGDIFDFDVGLGKQTLRHDFGPPSGAVPAMACSGGGDACPSMPLVWGGQTLRFGCNSTTAACFAMADVHLAYPVDAKQGASLNSIDREAVHWVRTIDLAYTVPVNTLSFDVPHVDLFVNPSTDDSLDQHSAGNVQLRQGLDPLTAGQPATAVRHLRIGSDDPAHGLIQQSILDGRTFSIVMAMSPRFDAGAPMPGGVIEVDIDTTVTVGVPWPW